LTTYLIFLYEVPCKKLTRKMQSLETHVSLLPLASHPGIHHHTVKNGFLVQSYLVITSWKELNILCHYE